MGFSPFAHGLLGVVAGQGKAAEGRMADQAKDEQMQRELEMRDEYLQRVEERKRQQLVTAGQEIDAKAEAGLASEALRGLGGGDLSAADLQALRDNPEAVAAYRKAGATGLMNPTRQQDAEAKADAARSLGYADIADKYENAAKGERTEARDQQRHEDAMRRLDRQIAQSEKASNRSDKTAEEEKELRTWMSRYATMGQNDPEFAKLARAKIIALGGKDPAAQAGDYSIVKESDEPGSEKVTGVFDKNTGKISPINSGGDLRSQAIDAVSRGADKVEVNKRLVAAGYEPI